MLTNVKVLPRRVAVAMVAALVVFAWVLGAAHSSSAQAAQIDDAITAVHVNPTVIGPFGKLTVDAVWSVPDSARGGDTFTMTLPDALSALNTSFELKDPAGDVVANAVVVGQKVTFTLTNFANNHNNVHGTAFFTTQLNLSHVSGPGTVPLEFTTPGKTYDTSVTVVATGTPGTASPRKSGNWVDTNTQDTLKWSLYSSAGAFAKAEFKDSVGAGQRFVCSSLNFLHATGVDSWGRLTGVHQLPAGRVISRDCNNTSLDIVVGPAVKGEVIVVQYQTVVTNPGLARYGNTATATVDGDSRSVSASVARLNAGGQGSGNTPTSTTTSPTSTTTSPTTTASPTSTTASPTSTTASPTSTTASPTSTTASPTTSVSPTSTSTSPTGSPTVLPTKITASPSGTSSTSSEVSAATLAFTGTDALPMVGLGLLLLGAGTALSMSGRRTRTRRH